MDLKDLLRKYLEIYPNEKNELGQVAALSSTEENPYNRKNFVGHCTAGAIVINESTKQVLMLDHAILHRLLPPGGHIALDETPLQGAYREMYEETGISSQDVEYRAVFPSIPLIPFDIDTHYIPANPKKNEEEHFHHDLRYLFIVNNEKVKVNKEESNGYRWLNWSDFIAQQNFVKMAIKIEELLSAKSQLRFYDNVFSSNETLNMRCIIIEHILPTTFDFILYMQSKFRQLKVFAKPKSKDARITERLKLRGVEIRDALRSGDLVKYYFENDLVTPTILIDIGGYFCGISQISGLPIKGIIEDTENGYQKYLNIQEKILYPVTTVARSPLKENEDRLVGEAVVHGADTLLRYENIIIDYCKVAVVGYGKVGAGICGALLKRHIKPYVVERNPVRLVSAVNNYCYASSFNEALEQVKVIFCATGSHSFTISDFRKIRNGAVLVSVTSSDDEFDLSSLHPEYTKSKISDHMTMYSCARNYFYVLNEGNAVNFLFGAALGSFIYLVMAEMLLCVKYFASNKENNETGIISMDTDKNKIAEQWLKEFAPIKK